VKHFAFALCILAAASAAWAQDVDLRVVVGFNGPADESVFTGHGGSSIKKAKVGNAAVGKLPVGQIEKVRALPGVAFVELDAVCEIQGGDAKAGKPGGAPSGPESYQPGMTPWGVTRVGGPSALNASGIIVGIVDTGVKGDHADLLGRVIGGVNNIVPNGSYFDDNDHGTHVAGTIGANQNSIGVVGVAPTVGIFAAKGLSATGSGYSSDLAEGIGDCVAAGARVINMSWGSAFANSLIWDALKSAAKAEVVLLGASGNEGNKRAVIYPAAYPEVLAIGATDSLDRLTSFTNTRGGLDLVAPGLYIWSTTVKNDEYSAFSGTSMATPHVSAAAALVLAQHPLMNKAAVEARLVDKATPLSNGYRLVNAAAASAP
jgi:subtilisin